jgi:2-polyprenyl-6-methoxyphenol hydroxylase-like FAD-dependent oxidoreductase
MENTDHAVVFGASIGGLLAARALSEVYSRVTVLDRDVLLDGPVVRRCVPQGRHLHALLAGGLQAMDELLPGLSDQLIGAGAPVGDLQQDLYWYNDGHRLCPANAGLRIVGAGRPLLEYVIRSRVAALPRVTITDGCDVLGLTTTADTQRVTGVRVRAGDGQESTIAADLVVDAGGRASRTPVWLEQLGYPQPAVENVGIRVTYVTRFYQREPHHLDGHFGAGGGAYPGLNRAGGVFSQEDDRFAVSLTGMCGEEPPMDDEGMAAYADALPAPQVAEILRTATPLGAPAKMRYPASTRRRYERLRRFPRGYLVVADALCNFNPIYGQGMTVAAKEALLLRRLLTDGADKLAQRFFRGAAALIDNPWSIAVGGDLRLPEVTGKRPRTARFTDAYVGRFHRAATTDPLLGTAFLRVINLLDPPGRLFAPGIAMRVLRGAGKGPARQPAA